MISQDTIDRYNSFRRFTDKSVLCHAPFLNLNFEQNGNITACCYNRRDILGRYPSDSILDAWTGSAAESLRQHIRTNELGGGCSICGELLQAGNFSGTKAQYYDEYVRNPLLPAFISKLIKAKEAAMPRVVELELSNTCNLECEMCTGYFSSTIRKNREQLPPLPMVYDQAFVKQLSQLMPGLTDMKFLGGEPFLVELYYEIWEEIARVNPDILVHITTNATIWNKRVQTLLEKLKAGIVVSLDSLQPDTYARIRQGAQLEKVLRHVENFKWLTREKNTYLSIAVCPMIHNWNELPELLHFANRNQAFIHFNVVWSPEELSIKSLPIDKILEVVNYLEAHMPSVSGINLKERKNAKAYMDLLETIRYWLQEKENIPDIRLLAAGQVGKWHAANDFSELAGYDPGWIRILAGILWFEFAMKLPGSIVPAEASLNLNDCAGLKDWMNLVKKDSGSRPFSLNFISVLKYLLVIVYGQPDQDAVKNLDFILSVIRSTAKIEQLARELMETPPLTQMENIRNFSPDKLESLMLARYS